MDSETKDVWQTFFICLLIGIVLCSIIFAVYSHIQNPNLYRVCIDGCKSTYYNHEDNPRIMECINKCNAYVGESLDKAITVINSTLEKINWTNP